jgi:hypothetical protein
MKKHLLISVLLVFWAMSSTAFGQDKEANSVKIENIKKLMTLTKADQGGKEILDQLIGTMKTLVPNAPSEFWDGMKQGMDFDELRERLIPVYDKYLSNEDVIELIKFYESPVGRKVISVLPSISKESFAIGSEYGRELADRIVKKLKEKGYQVPN